MVWALENITNQPACNTRCWGVVGRGPTTYALIPNLCEIQFGFVNINIFLSCLIYVYEYCHSLNSTSNQVE